MQNRIKGGSVSRRLSEQARARASAAPSDAASGGTYAAGIDGAAHGVGALFARLRDVVEQLTQTAGATGEAAADTAAGPKESGASFSLGGREGRMVFGYTIRMGADGVRAEPFGDVATPGPAAARAPHEAPPPAKPAAAARAPIVDVFEEAGLVTIIAELPGAAETDTSCTLDGAVLRIAATGAHAYEKTVTLPPGLDPGSLTQSLRNGILEVRLSRKPAP
jgi:HSP20 family molecular chaperone IbpA